MGNDYESVLIFGFQIEEYDICKYMKFFDVDDDTDINSYLDDLNENLNDDLLYDIKRTNKYRISENNFYKIKEMSIEKYFNMPKGVYLHCITEYEAGGSFFISLLPICYKTNLKEINDIYNDVLYKEIVEFTKKYFSYTIPEIKLFCVTEYVG
jgi:hypothetical protein